jgi:hypothetical protein
MTSCTLAANFGSFDGLKSAHPVRLQPMRRPDPLHAATADPGRLGPRPTGSVRCLAGRFGQRHLDHPLDRLYRQRSGGLRAARVASCSGPSTPSAVKRACQRQIVGLPAVAGLPPDRLVPTSSALSSTIRARHTGFCAPFPDRGVQPSRSPEPSRISMPFFIQPDPHTSAPAGTIRQRPSTRWMNRSVAQ